MTATPTALPRYFLLLVSAMTALAPFAIDTYLPALPAMASAFDVSLVVINASVSTYLLGFGIGQLIGGPISDQIGRRPVGLFGLCLFIVGSFAITFADSANMVVALRPLQALGGGCVSAICMAMVRDSYSPTEAAKRFPIVTLVMLAAPLLAPVVGTLLLPLGWQWIFVFLAAYAAVMFVLFLNLGETHNLRSGKIDVSRFLPQYLEVLCRRVDGRLLPLRYLLTSGLVSSALMVFLTNSAFIYLEYFDVGATLFPIYFGANVLTMMVFTLITARVVRHTQPFKIFTIGRLAQLTAVSVLALTTLATPTNLWLFAPALALVIGCTGLVGPSISGLYLANFSKLAGSAGALSSMATFGFGGILGALSGVLYDGTLRPVALIMLAAIVAANLIARTIPAPRDWSDEAIEAAQERG
ncbi:MAG: multidrug effflux MFS transporter [Pseudomonadaceae bacterium]|nr:multidrug effflux MFS transporter [Pseudomonadaceae bacterium]